MPKQASPMLDKQQKKKSFSPFTVIVLLLKISFWIFVFLTPLLGVWLASSLASYLNGPRWLAIASGALLFPVLPVVWDMLSERRRAKKGSKVRYLKGGDRIILRTLFVNLVFIVSLLLVNPTSAFTALSARGDWMLDEETGVTANDMRVKLYTVADRLEWLYELTHENPYEVEPPQHSEDVPASHGGGSKKSGSGKISKTNTIAPIRKASRPPSPVPGQSDMAAEAPEKPNDVPFMWPLNASIHPAVVSMPDSSKSDIRDIAAYLGSREQNPYLLVKAIHDYVADRVHYDFATLDAGGYPPYDAETVNRTRSGVCAGYAKLFAAIAESAGFECAYISGQTRQRADSVDGSSHAWNAIRIEDNWYLVDPTWDSAHANRKGEVAEFRTDYLLTPPNVFALDHFPKDVNWQLLEKPLTRGEFIRQPMLTARFHRQKLSLISPTRSQVTVDEKLVIQIDKPDNLFLLATYNEKGQSHAEKCNTRYEGNRATLTCPLPQTATYQVILFSNAGEYGNYTSVGQIEAVRI